jgi:hypothetical protein
LLIFLESISICIYICTQKSSNIHLWPSAPKAPKPQLPQPNDFLKELLNPTRQLKTPAPRPAKKSAEFDLNEIKTFKFKKSTSRGGKRQQQANKQTPADNPWDCLMDEIRTNPCGHLKKVESRGRHRKFAASGLDYGNFQGSQLIRDLNLILSQRSQFFNDDEDEDSSDDWDCSNGN